MHQQWRQFWGRGITALAAVFLLFSSSTLVASAGSQGASFLQIPVGAGPAAMGGAYSALAADAYAPVWNPAGLGFLNSTQLAGQHLSYLESINYEHIGFVTPLGLSDGLPRYGSIGVTAQYLGSGTIPGRNEDGVFSG